MCNEFLSKYPFSLCRQCLCLLISALLPPFTHAGKIKEIAKANMISKDVQYTKYTNWHVF